MTSNPNLLIPEDPPLPQHSTVSPTIPPSSSANNLPNTSCNTHQEQYASSNSPYILNHSDTSNLILVTELVTDNNYVIWSRSMVLAVSIQNKLGFIDVLITKPAGELLPLWIWNNNVVIAWILNSTSKGILSSILFTQSARATWIDLQDCFQKRNGPRIFQLKCGLSTLKQDQESVTMYFANIKSLWDEYASYHPGCTCGKCACSGTKSVEDFVNFECLMYYLMGLNDDFNHACSQVLIMDPPPAINKAFSLIVQQE
ncbi:uncharacterized protein LOC103496792 [Cucumis melo]|uniref:Uncharacterized protein LOC103496792 n=1 Tax=Cucumis melo TaxID=3656 RepID=A0A1S3C5T4_CUCME|nr:uncharacterized protein LOC103496792 [Cucumis melo]